MIVKQILSKGQIVIPKTIRELLGIKFGDKINIDVNNGKIILSKKQNIEKTFSKICNKHSQKISTKQIKKELKQRYRFD